MCDERSVGLALSLHAVRCLVVIVVVVVHVVGRLLVEKRLVQPRWLAVTATAAVIAVHTWVENKKAVFEFQLKIFFRI